MKTTKFIWGGRTFEYYKPKKNKVKVGLVGGFAGLCLITPCTNWALIPMFKLLGNNPGWLYR